MAVLAVPFIATLAISVWGEHRRLTGPYGYFAKQLGSADQKLADKAIKDFFSTPRSIAEAQAFLTAARFECAYLQRIGQFGLESADNGTPSKAGQVYCHYFQGGWLTFPYILVALAPIGEDGFSDGSLVRTSP